MKKQLNEIRRMQQLAGLIKENYMQDYQGGLTDPANEYPDSDYQNESTYEETEEVIDRMFKEEGVDLSSPLRKQASDLLNDISSGSVRSFHTPRMKKQKELFANGNSEDLGVDIAVMVLGI